MTANLAQSMLGIWQIAFTLIITKCTFFTIFTNTYSITGSSTNVGLEIKVKL